MDLSPADKEMLGRSSTGRSTDLDVEDPEALAARRRSFHSKVLIGGLITTVVLGLALGLGLGLTVGRHQYDGEGQTPSVAFFDAPPSPNGAGTLTIRAKEMPHLRKRASGCGTISTHRPHVNNNFTSTKSHPTAPWSSTQSTTSHRIDTKALAH
ncbi:hypothetical protein SVAN01_09103 [Stagonosporopsis vannaccii]|nr:hypothetical protein SVAN01_09103 [Stagonosporopsis vannaccii]